MYICIVMFRLHNKKQRITARLFEYRSEALYDNIRAFLFKNMNSKVCSKCKYEKGIIEFHKAKFGKYGVSSKCINCTKEWHKKYRENNPEKRKEACKKYRENNKEKIKEDYKNNKGLHKKYRENNVEKIRIAQKKWRENNINKVKDLRKKWRENNKEKSNQDIKKWRENNKEKIKEYKRQYEKNKKDTNQLYKLKYIIKNAIGRSMSKRGFTKKSKTFEILGCDYETFKNHIENQFEDWMSWDNHGKYNGEFNFGWDIDHIIPLASAKTEEDVIRLNHYTNLQPLCSKVNRHIKSDKI